MRNKYVLLALFGACLFSIAHGTVLTGSGCAIGRNHIITAAHVVSGAVKVEVQFCQETPIPAEVIRIDKIEDWAILKMSYSVSNSVGVSTSMARLSDKVYVLGYPTSALLGENVKYSEGVISSSTGLCGKKENFQFSAPVQPGNSGGPIFNERGLLVGIVLSSVNAEAYRRATRGALPQNINFGLHVASLGSVINEYVDNDNTVADTSVEYNQKATCFIRATVSQSSLDTVVSVNNKSSEQSDAMLHSIVYDGVWSGSYSPRFLSIISTLLQFTKHKFEQADGTIIIPRTGDDFETLFSELSKMEDIATAEVLSLDKSVSSYINRDLGKLRWLCTDAYNAIVEEFERNRITNITDLREQKFWGARLGDRCGHESHDTGFGYADNFLLLSGSRFLINVTQELEGFRHAKKCHAYLPDGKKFYGQREIQFFVTDAWKLLGVFCELFRLENREHEVVIEDLKNIFETRYLIRFRRMQSNCVPSKTSVNSVLHICTDCAKAYIYEDNGISIVIFMSYDNHPAVSVSYTDFCAAALEDCVTTIKGAELRRPIRKSDLDAL